MIQWIILIYLRVCNDYFHDKYIYRIEHKDRGTGIWNVHPLAVIIPQLDPLYELGSIRRQEFTERWNVMRTPVNDDRIRRYPYDKEYCAFSNLRDMKKFIKPDEFEILQKKGFRLYQLKIKDYSKIRTGKDQTLYRKSAVKYLDISKMY